jgi:hypothetical protein
MPNINNRPIGENTPNLVALFDSKQRNDYKNHLLLSFGEWGQEKVISYIERCEDLADTQIKNA